MLIRKPRGFGFKEIVLVTVLGVLGGVYIWKPLLLKYVFENQTKPLDHPKDTEEQSKKLN